MIWILILTACSRPMPMSGVYLFRLAASLDEGDCNYDSDWYHTSVSSEIEVAALSSSFTLASEEDARIGGYVSCEMDEDYAFSCDLKEVVSIQSTNPDFEGSSEEIPVSEQVEIIERHRLEGEWKDATSIQGILYRENDCGSKPDRCATYFSRFSDDGAFEYPCTVESAFVADLIEATEVSVPSDDTGSDTGAQNTDSGDAGSSDAAPDQGTVCSDLIGDSLTNERCPGEPNEGDELCVESSEEGLNNYQCQEP